jgi:nucleoside phosphorylase
MSDLTGQKDDTSYDEFSKKDDKNSSEISLKFLGNLREISDETHRGD